MQESGWAPGPVRTCAKNLGLAGIDYTVPTLRFIKTRPCNSRPFKLPCNDMRSEYETFMSHAEVYWLSRVKFLMTMFQLKTKIIYFSV
jgi:hypothetical protein